MWTRTIQLKVKDISYNGSGSGKVQVAYGSGPQVVYSESSGSSTGGAQFSFSGSSVITISAYLAVFRLFSLGAQHLASAQSKRPDPGKRGWDTGAAAMVHELHEIGELKDWMGNRAKSTENFWGRSALTNPT
ncbi:MAG: hypothetical protein AAF483_23685 [Planctomycetota bacterium]